VIPSAQSEKPTDLAAAAGAQIISNGAWAEQRSAGSRKMKNLMKTRIYVGISIIILALISAIRFSLCLYRRRM
jgi:hypothetical protein